MVSVIDLFLILSLIADIVIRLVDLFKTKMVIRCSQIAESLNTILLFNSLFAAECTHIDRVSTFLALLQGTHLLIRAASRKISVAYASLKSSTLLSWLDLIIALLVESEPNLGTLFSNLKMGSPIVFIHR